MSSHFKQMYHVLLYATTILLPGAAADCPEQIFKHAAQQYTWPSISGDDLWIASDFLDDKRRLIFRHCLDRTWTPTISAFESVIKEKMAEFEVKHCPYLYKQIELQGMHPRTICVLDHGMQYNFDFDKSACIQDSIFVMDLTVEEQTQLIKAIGPDIYVQAARNRYPDNLLSFVNYRTVDVELQDITCGRFGMPIKFSKNTVPVTCTQESECKNVCLSLNATVEPFFAVIHNCSEYKIAKPKNTFLHRLGCRSDGYYRIEYDYINSDYPDACFSIRSFPHQIPIGDVRGENVIETYCDGTIMSLTSAHDMFIFRELGRLAGLSDDSHCLFGLSTNAIVSYADWESIDSSKIRGNLTWDKTMNYSRILKESSYLASKMNGQWTWAVDSVSCIACMMNTPIPLPTLRLTYKTLERKLELVVNDQEFLYRDKSSDPGFICFAEVRGVYWANLTVISVAGSIGKYLIEDVGFGEYLCTGHSVIKRRYVGTERVMAYGMWFAFHVARKCATDCSFSIFDLNQFIVFFQQNYEFAFIADSAIVSHEPAESDREYTFVAYLRLALSNYIVDDSISSLVSWTDYQLETAFIYEQLNRIHGSAESNELTIKSIRSTQYCLHDSSLSIDSIIWRIALIGETISPSPLCPSPAHSSQITRTCRDEYGSLWEEPTNVPQCHTFVSESLLALYVNVNRNANVEIIDHLNDLLQRNVDRLLPLDVFLTNHILRKISSVTISELNDVFSIYNILQQIDDDLLHISASMNSTNVLLEAFENILLTHIRSCIIDSTAYRTSGNASIHSASVQTFVLDPIVSGASGMALYRPRNSSTSDDNFLDYSFRFIYPNETIDDLLTDGVSDEDELVVGSYLPANMLSTLTDINVVMTFFFNDKLFQPNDPPDKRPFRANGKIISINILGLDNNSQLPSNIPIFFESNRTDDSACGYWNFTSTSGWSTTGCNLSKIWVNDVQQVAMCECSHLTHFTQMINNNVHEHVKMHERPLTMITVIGSSFSLCGTCGIFMTAVLFKNWRQKLGSKILIHFSAAITLEMCLMILTNFDDRMLNDESNKIGCVALGSIRHYSILVMYVWMLIIAYFQFKRYVLVFNLTVSHLLAKSTILAWVGPLFSVLIVLVVDHSSYLPKGDVKFCYPTGWALNFGVIVPIALIFVVDSIVYASVLVSLHRGLSNSVCLAEVAKYRLRLSHLRLSAFLFSTLGLTWIFGFLSKIHQNCYLVFAYLFCITATIQGLVLFLYFIVFDQNVRALWIKYFRNICRK